MNGSETERLRTRSTLYRLSRAVGSRLPRGLKARVADGARHRPALYRAKLWYLGNKCDAFLISFPKCGRTWLRQMIATVIESEHGVEGNPMAFTDGRLTVPGVPRILSTHDDNPQVKAPAQIMRDKRGYRNHDVVFLARDPRDVVVSHYFHRTKRLRDGYAGSISDYVREPVGSARSLVAFYNVWAERRDVPRSFHLARYEDLRADPQTGLTGVLDTFGMAASEAAVEAAVEAASFERMREREAGGTAGTKALKAADASDAESFKVRRGVVGGYRDYLSDDDVAYLDTLIAGELDPVYGYGR